MSARVYVWRARRFHRRDTGTVKNFGHASLAIDGGSHRRTYISWWPDRFDLWATVVTGTGHRIMRSYDDDREAMKHTADHSILIRSGLDESAMIHWWEKLRHSHTQYTLLHRNCCDTVLAALAIGIANRPNVDDLLPPVIMVPFADPAIVLSYVWRLRKYLHSHSVG